MIDLTRKIKMSDRFYKDGTLVTTAMWNALGGFRRYAGRGDESKASTLQVVYNEFGYKVLDPAVYDGATQKLTGVIIDKVTYVTQEVVDKTQDEIDAELAALQDSQIDSIARAACEYVESEIDAAGMVRFNSMAATGNTKALDIQIWIESIYYEAEHMKALVMNGTWDGDTDFSHHGEKPWTVAQVLMG